MAIRDILMRRDIALTPSEEKIARLLLTDYPGAGLGSASSLARRAGVSDPTVVRLVVKLGYAGYPDFQAKLMAEVEARLQSPLLMMDTRGKPPCADEPTVAYLASVGAALNKTAGAAPPATLERAARLIIEARGEVLLLGGRFSRHVAGMFAGYLAQLRRGVRDLGSLSAQTFDVLSDLGRRDVLVVFDYRRYQRDVISFARQAAARDVRVVLFTDPWLSPLAEEAEVTVVSSLEVTSPFDTLAPAVAQVEALTARVLSLLGADARARVERLEDVRHANDVTLDSELDGAPSEAAPGRPRDRASHRQDHG